MANIPKVKAPMDFGIEYLESPSHGNLRFLLEGDEELLANSAIMSFNSPVIKKITIKDGRTTVDVQDFSKDAVQCFLEASYSGTLKKISKPIFRDVNKIAHVFEVTWLIDRCFEYFESLTKAVKEDNFAHQLYVFDEAMFILDKLNKRTYIDTVIKKFTSLTSCIEFFAIKYVSDISPCSSKSLDVIMEMTKEQEHILVRGLLINLEIEKSSLNQNGRRILEKLNFTTRPPTHESLYQKLLKKLENIENPSAEDLRLIVKILQQSSRALEEINPYAALPNLFHGFQQLQDINDLEGLTDFLINSPLVSNSYVFYDAIFDWLTDKYHVNKSPFVPITNRFVKIFVDHVTEKRWKPLARDYIECKTHAELGKLNKKILKVKNPNLVTSGHYYRVISISEYTPDELFARNHDIAFKFYDYDSITNCSEKGHCGFILRVTAASGEQDDSFNIQLVIDPSLYHAGIHFHKDSLLAENMHLALEITEDKKVIWSNRSVTWQGKPRRDGTYKSWCWGAYWFYKEDEGLKPVGESYLGVWHCGSTAKIRPVVYYLG